MRLSHRVPIIKAVGDACNLRCDYCFYNGMNQRSNDFMSKAQLESFMRQYFALFSGELCFVWHGGEPLLADIDFYAEAVSLQRELAKPGDVVENKIQTNATLIDDAWAAFFKKNNFKVGVSIDGGRASHNCHRKDVGGHGTFDAVMRGLQVLRQHGLMPGIIHTVTRSTVGAIRADMEFFYNELRSLGWAVNLFAEDSSPQSCVASEGLTNEDVSRVHDAMFRFWLEKNDERLSIREIENIVAGVTGHRGKGCSFNGTCANYFCLDNHSRVWPCDRLSSDSRFLLGDLRCDTLKDVLEGSAAEQHAVRARQLSEHCVPCRWRNACNNGCTAMRDPNTGTYVYCDARQRAFETMSVLLDTQPAH